MARVTVNRFWQMYFGTGIVKTAEDFGSQGEPPSHPELLDWLATEFVRTGWDVKALQKTIVMSATYRQASSATPALLEKDPDNRLLARGPNIRLSADMIRDQALALAGLLVDRIGGPSVKPYQPEGFGMKLGAARDRIGMPTCRTTGTTCTAAVCIPSGSAPSRRRAWRTSTPRAARPMRCASMPPIRRCRRSI